MGNGTSAVDTRVDGLVDGRRPVEQRQNMPGLIPGTDQFQGMYEEMRVPSDMDQGTSWIVHLHDGGSETVPGTFTFRLSSGCMIFHQWGENGEGERRERKARYIFPLERIKFVRKIDE